MPGKAEILEPLKKRCVKRIWMDYGPRTHLTLVASLPPSVANIMGGSCIWSNWRHCNRLCGRGRSQSTIRCPTSSRSPGARNACGGATGCEQVRKGCTLLT